MLLAIGHIILLIFGGLIYLVSALEDSQERSEREEAEKKQKEEENKKISIADKRNELLTVGENCSLDKLYTMCSVTETTSYEEFNLECSSAPYRFIPEPGVAIVYVENGSIIERKIFTPDEEKGDNYLEQLQAFQEV